MRAPHAKVEEVKTHAEDKFDAVVKLLSDYLTYPAISCDKDHFGDVQRLAERIQKDLHSLGFERSRVLELEDALPSVAAEWMKAGPEKPTVLIYGHLDLQPVKGEVWDTPPHEATIKDGRLYARGSADDMGGWVSHLAALQSWLDVAGELPCNVKLFIEGEEEIGSPNLERFMDAFPDAFESDVMVLTDCENPSTEIPGLTTSLRGLLEVDVKVTALTSDVHSGLWGNMGPDASLALVMLLRRLVDDDGRFCLAPADVPSEWAKAAWDVPLDNDAIKSGSHLAPGVEPIPPRDRAPAEWLWRQPSVTVLSTTLPTAGNEKNALRAGATATLSIRVAPGQTSEELMAKIREALLSDPPSGVLVEVTERDNGAESWLYVPEGPAFPAADRAYKKAWGRELLQVGIGGSIPFVALFGKRYGDLPLILNGVMDPATGAHGPNESMHLGVFKKAIVANVYLLEELSRVPELIREKK